MQEVKPAYTSLYKPSQKRAMHVVVFGSGSGTNLEALLRAQRESKSKDRPFFEVKALFTDRQCRFHEIAERERLPLIYHSFVDFFKELGNADYQDSKMREAYDKRACELLNFCAKSNHFFVDVILLAGYMRLVYPPLLDSFPNKILNVHPADLTAVDKFGKRKYVGANAVFDALMDGVKQTRSSVILVNRTMDAGPIIVSGPWTTYTGGQPVTFKRAAYHQDKQKVCSDWIASIQAIELIASGRVSIDDKRTIYIDDKPTEDGGYVIQ